MKKGITIMLGLLICSGGKAQEGSTEKAVIDQLFAKAFHCELYSNERQLYLDSILQIDAKNAYAWQQKGMPLFKQKKYELGLPFIDSAAKYDPHRWLSYRAFMKAIFQKSYRAALADFESSEKLLPRGFVMDHSFDFYRGLCYLQLNMMDSAIYFISRSINDGIQRVGEGHFFERWYLGIALLERGDFQRAIAEFDLGLKGYPRFSDIKYYKALCLQKLGDTEQCRVLLAEALLDLNAGYTISEDSVIYEEYPYQIKKSNILARMERLSAKN